MTVIQMFVTDYRRLRPQGRLTPVSVLRALLSNPGLVAALLLRLQMAAVKRNRWGLAGAVRSLCLVLTGADFVPGCRAGSGLLMHHPNGIVLGAGARLGESNTLLQQVTFGERHADGSGAHAYPTSGDRCVFGAGSRVLGGITIGDDASVGANAVVLHNVAERTTVVGAPAKPIG